MKIKPLKQVLKQLYDVDNNIIVKFITNPQGVI